MTSMIAKRFYHHQQSLIWLRATVLAHEEAIVQLQKECPHVWEFHHQSNAYHDHKWNVYWRCRECTAAKVDKEVPPICPQCECNLEMATPDDTEAQALRKKTQTEMCQNATAFRCMTCNTPYALMVKGD